MADLIYVAVLIGFFALAALFVVACDHIVGPDADGVEAAPDAGAADHGAPVMAARR